MLWGTQGSFKQEVKDEVIIEKSLRDTESLLCRSGHGCIVFIHNQHTQHKLWHTELKALVILFRKYRSSIDLPTLTSDGSVGVDSVPGVEYY